MEILKHKLKWNDWNQDFTGNTKIKISEGQFQDCRHIEDFEEPKKKSENVVIKIEVILKEMSRFLSRIKPVF